MYYARLNSLAHELTSLPALTRSCMCFESCFKLAFKLLNPIQLPSHKRVLCAHKPIRDNLLANPSLGNRRQITVYAKPETFTPV